MGVLAPKPKTGPSIRDSLATPPEVYAELHAEFRFTLDPCPLDTTPIAGAPLWGKDGTRRSWAGQRVFCNPPYSDISPWLAKGREAALAVFLLPVRTSLAWWHDHAMGADEIRFVRGRIRFVGMESESPFASVVVIFDERRGAQGTKLKSWSRPPTQRATA